MRGRLQHDQPQSRSRANRRRICGSRRTVGRRRRARSARTHAPTLARRKETAERSDTLRFSERAVVATTDAVLRASCLAVDTSAHHAPGTESRQARAQTGESIDRSDHPGRLSRGGATLGPARLAVADADLPSLSDGHLALNVKSSCLARHAGVSGLAGSGRAVWLAQLASSRFAARSSHRALLYGWVSASRLCAAPAVCRLARSARSGCRGIRRCRPRDAARRRRPFG